MSSVEAVRANDGTLVPVWSHRKKGWEFSKDTHLWQQAEFLHCPTAYCLGERYIHAHFGVDSFGNVWFGSTPDNWHGFGGHGADLTAAQQWVREALYPELGFTVWGLPQPDVSASVNQSLGE